MSDPLDLVHLRTVVAIADCGGFHRAAAALQLSQSTVSQHVRLLERGFKEPLVRKSGRGSSFTVAGEALLVEARRILAVHDQALQRLDLKADPALRLGCTEHAADTLLPQLLSALRGAFPGRVVRFRIARSTVLEDDVARGDLDLALVLAAGEPNGVEAGRLGLFWYAANGFVGPEAGRPWPLVVFEEPCGLRRRALTALDGHGLTAAVVVESSGLEGVVAGVRAGLGVALLPGTGRVPDGLREVPELPALGLIGIQVVGRRGVDLGLEGAVTAVAGRLLQASAAA